VQPLDRRSFLRRSASCAAHLSLLAASPGLARRVFAADGRRPIVAQEPWGRIEEVGDGLWALISTPLQDRTTLCNGGIVRGRSAVAVVESFAQPDGAAWLAEQARTLTGRWPDIAVLTHYHGDHAAGVEGYARDGGATRIHLTEPTRELIRAQDARRDTPPAPERVRLLDGADVIDTEGPVVLDLGGRSVRVVPYDGHTASDVTIELEEPAVVWCGDLVWNRMVPNYVDAVPSRLGGAVRALVRSTDTTYIPGHGPIADAAALRVYLDLLDDIEAAARRAHESGTSAAAAAAEYVPPAATADWTVFSPRYFEVAIGAWLREIREGNRVNDRSVGTNGTQPFGGIVVS